jgi:FkbM family methyltransferase
MKKILLKISIRIINLLIDCVLRILVPKNLDAEKDIFYKWYLIRKSNEIQKKIFKKVKFKSIVQYDPKKDNFYCAYPKPIMLRTDLTNKYYKNSNHENNNDASTFLQLFDKKENNIVIDIGSCFGEISIFLGKKLVNSKIISVEGSKINSEIQKNNIVINNISNIILVENIIADNEEYFISNNRGSENFIEKKNENYLTKVKSITLDDLIQKYEIEIIDFIKIDIEGSAPLLSNDLINLNNKKKIKNIMIAFEKNSYESYSKIIQSFKENLYSFKIDYVNNKFIYIDYDLLIKTLQENLPKSYDQSNKWALDVLFSDKKID